nr:MAG TPA: hypothetical protein [Caudoviricetes sp.]
MVSVPIFSEQSTVSSRLLILPFNCFLVKE